MQGRGGARWALARGNAKEMNAPAALRSGTIPRFAAGDNTKGFLFGFRKIASQLCGSVNYPCIIILRQRLRLAELGAALTPGARASAISPSRGWCYQSVEKQDGGCED